jgi:anti-sigma factor RsiW
MHTNPVDEWLEIQRQRPLHPHEEERLQACLSRDPELAARWEQEQALTRLLRELPDVPVPSNFNAKVWAAAQRAAVPTSPLDRIVGWLRLPRPVIGPAMAACVLALLAGGLGYSQYQSVHRAHMAASLVDIARGMEIAAVAAELPAEEVLRDFEAIYQLGRVRSLADEELLAALQ